MSTKFEELCEELKKTPKTGESGLKYLTQLMGIFVVDFESAMDRRFDVVFWRILKKLIDQMVSASAEQVVYENVVNLALGFLTDLCVLVHASYRMPDVDLPEFLTSSALGMRNKRVVKSQTRAKVFCAFVMLRMGDLMRYKGYSEKAREFYEISVTINRAEGATWNQLGLMTFKSADFLKSVYCHTRALHATLGFPTASTNLASIFKKFANRDTSKDMPISEKCVSILAKLHFLLKIEGGEELLRTVGGEMAENEEFILPLMSVYENLEGDTELENQAIQAVKIIWKSGFMRVLEKMEKKTTAKLVQMLGLYLRIQAFCDMRCHEVQNVWEVLKTGNEPIEDELRFDHFRCLKESMLEYPLVGQKVAKYLENKVEVKGEDRNDSTGLEDEEDSYFDEEEREEETTIATSSSASSSQVENDDSEEEILKRGARRRMASSGDEESDDDDLF